MNWLVRLEDTGKVSLEGRPQFFPRTYKFTIYCKSSTSYFWYAASHSPGQSLPALFTFTVRISVGRKRSDVVVCDEGIAPAMSEEQNATDDPFAVDRKLTAKVNKADRSYMNSTGASFTLKNCQKEALSIFHQTRKIPLIMS